MAALGRYSYGIYIWHVFAAQLALGALHLEWETATPAAQAVKYGAAITIGVLATVLVERPVLRLRDRFLPAARPVPVAPKLVATPRRTQPRVPEPAAA
jgi:peptidoglycan/LPS O-acetylase OafA/YrhL